jgi:probable HAF family extracellular repeat protein
MSYATALNSSQIVVGSSQVSGSSNYHAFKYSGGVITDLGVLPNGTSSNARGISSSNNIVGYATADTQGHVHAVYNMNDLGTLDGGDSSEANAINGSNHVAGDSRTSTGSTVGFFYDPSTSTFTKLGNLGGTRTQAWAITAGDVLAGESDLADGTTQAFKQTIGSAMVGLGIMRGWDSSWAWALNDLGDVAGYSFNSTDPNGAHEASYKPSGGTWRDLGLFGGNTSEALGINHSEQIVGVSTTGTSRHAFLWDSVNGIQDLNSLIPQGSGWILNDARAINDGGYIVGKGTYNGDVRAYLLTPTTSAPDAVPPPLAPVDHGLGLPESCPLRQDMATANPVAFYQLPATLHASAAAADYFWISEGRLPEQPWWEWDVSNS